MRVYQWSDINHYERIRNYCWYRAHKNTTDKWRTRWFDLYEVADQMILLIEEEGE